MLQLQVVENYKLARLQKYHFKKSQKSCGKGDYWYRILDTSGFCDDCEIRIYEEDRILRIISEHEAETRDLQIIYILIKEGIVKPYDYRTARKREINQEIKKLENDLTNLSEELNKIEESQKYDEIEFII